MCFAVWKELGSAYKESAYQKALILELGKRGIPSEKEKTLHVSYDGEVVGSYRPDFVIDAKVLLEVKALPFLPRVHRSQFWRYLKGSPYRVGFLVNFGGKELEIVRRVYDTVRPRRSADSPR